MITKLYDEEVVREITPAPWATEDNKDACDIHYLRCRLFKMMVQDTSGLTREDFSVYLLVSSYKSYAGDPTAENGTARWPKHRTQCKAYVSGPDSKRIRQAIALLDSFSTQRASSSK